MRSLVNCSVCMFMGFFFQKNLCIKTNAKCKATEIRQWNAVFSVKLVTFFHGIFVDIYLCDHILVHLPWRRIQILIVVRDIVSSLFSLKLGIHKLSCGMPNWTPGPNYFAMNVRSGLSFRNSKVKQLLFLVTYIALSILPPFQHKASVCKEKHSGDLGTLLCSFY